MHKNIIYTFPEIALLLGLLHLFLLYLAKTDKPKTYFAASRFWLLVSLFFAVLYYDKSFTPLLSPNAYTLLFYLLTGFFAYISLGLSSYWFSAKNRYGCLYSALMLSALLCFKIMLETLILPVLFAAYTLSTLIGWRMVNIHYDKNAVPASSRFFFISVAITLLFGIGVLYLSMQTPEPLYYQTLNTLFKQQSDSLPNYLSAVSIAVAFLYALGIAPFHIASEDKAGKSILPVSHYFAVVAPLALLGTFIKLNTLVLPPFGADFAPVYTLFALLSVIFGALGANARINLYRITAYLKIYFLGIILLLLSYFNREASYAALLVLIISIIAFNGLYLVFYGLKSRGDYLTSVTSLSGLAENKPYTAAVLIISLFSLIGIPPLAGFLAEMNIINELISQKSYISLGFIFFFWLILAKSCLELIKAAYFDRRIKIYDTENKLLVFYIFLNILLLTSLMFNPFNLIETMKDMFYVIYL